MRRFRCKNGVVVAKKNNNKMIGYDAFIVIEQSGGIYEKGEELVFGKIEKNGLCTGQSLGIGYDMVEEIFTHTSMPVNSNLLLLLEGV